MVYGFLGLDGAEMAGVFPVVSSSITVIFIVRWVACGGAYLNVNVCFYIFFETQDTHLCHFRFYPSLHANTQIRKDTNTQIPL